MTDGSRRNSLARGIGVLFITFVSFNCSICLGFWGQKQYQKIERVSAPVSGIEAISVKTDSGDITFTVADTNDCNVTATITAQSFKADDAGRLAEQTRVKLELEGNSVQVMVEKPKAGFADIIAIAYEIIIPPGTNVDCETSFGKISLLNIKGNVTAVTSMGDIKTEGVTGRMQLDTSYGDIDCNGITSSYLAAKSSFGNIKVAFTDTCPNNLAARLETSFGDIVVVLPSAFAGEIAAKTGFGKITTDVPILIKGEINKNKIIGKVGSGNAWLDLKTSFGNVSIK
ncbi:MAG: DUF4097 family beta strand repeat-containing protein [Sedimentisphaerales bacterium]